MTCQVKVSGPDGHVTKASALLGSASLTSFVTDLTSAATALSAELFQVAGIGGTAHSVSHCMVSFHVANSNNASTLSGNCWRVEIVYALSKLGKMILWLHS